MKLIPHLTAGLLLSLSANVCAEAVKDREGAVRKDKATMENDARWIYNDVQRGFEEAKRTGKPLLVVLRCIPCLNVSISTYRIQGVRRRLQLLRSNSRKGRVVVDDGMIRPHKLVQHHL